MLRSTRLLSAATLGLLLGAACHNDELFRPLSRVPIDPLFERYVSIGTSITAGFQSDGINDSTQVQSFAVLLARQMRTPFFSPLMTRPGCPPPLTDIYAQTRVGGGNDLTCLLRKPETVPPPYLSNVAVPGALVTDAVGNDGSPNPLTTFFLGGLDQFQALRRANPTFVTVELGVTDVLGAVVDQTNAGNPALVTLAAPFEAQYTTLLDSLENVDPAGVLLIGVPHVAVLPYLSKGSYFHTIANRAPTDVTPDTFPPNFVVDPNCAAAAGGDFVLIPFPHGAARVAFAKANPAAVVGVDCAEDVNVLPAELAGLVAAVDDYNTVIEDEALARSAATGRPWVFVDPNALLAALPPGAIPAFPNTPPRPTSVTEPFGAFFSRDGVSPSAATHKLIANALITVINIAYGTAIPAIP